jgi:hypothetical protein
MPRIIVLGRAAAATRMPSMMERSEYVLVHVREGANFDDLIFSRRVDLFCGRLAFTKSYDPKVATR